MTRTQGPGGFQHIRPEERFWEKVDFNGPAVSDELGPCWLWTGSRHANGYGYTTDYWKKILAHRLAWEMFNGPIATGKNVCHSCDVRNCVNPRHLWVGTQSENIRDAVVKDRLYRGNPNPRRGVASRQARLTDEQVREIRERYKPGKPGRPSATDPPRESLAAIAAEYGVATSLVHRIVKRTAWSHLD